MLCDKKHSHVQWRDFKMNVLVCDDDQQIVDSIIEELKKKSEETHVALRFYGFSQPSQIDLSLPYDIALLDIDMGETNGIELARKLRAENGNIVIIFITNFIQYAPEGFEVQAFRYLLKADFSAKLDSYFDSAVQEVLQRKQLVTISINSEIIDVPVNDILYLESHRRIIVMHLLDEKRPAYQFYGNITELSEKIEPLGFLRIQKSYLVNMHYVEIFQYNKVQLRGGLCLAPSEKNYNELKQVSIGNQLIIEPRHFIHQLCCSLQFLTGRFTKVFQFLEFLFLLCNHFGKGFSRQHTFAFDAG